MQALSLKPGLTDDFEERIVSQFDGYNSSVDKTNIKETFLVRGSQNVYKKLSGTIAARPGLKLRGAVDTTLAKVDSSFEWNTSKGTTLPMRVSNGNLQVESDVVISGTPIWYTLLSSLTTTRWVFDAWWDNAGVNNGQSKKDVLLMVDGTAALRNWSGAMALFVSATSNTIVLDRDAATAGFSTAGTVVLSDGSTATYSGISASTLTGVSVDFSAKVAPLVVFEGVKSNATTPAAGFLGDFLRVVNNHVFIGSYTSRLVYLSKISSYLDYAQSTPRVPGDGDVLTLDSVGKGIGIKDGNAWIGAGTDEWYEVSFSQITVGSTLSEQTKVDKKPVSVLSAPLGHEFIDMIGNDLVSLCQDHQVRMIGNFTDQFETKYPSLSLAVQDELFDEVFTTGHLRAIGSVIYMTAPNSGKDYMHETREQINALGQIVTERFWHPPQIRSISRFAVISGTVFGHSAVNPQLYQVWNTNQWHDDSPTSLTTGVPYECRMLMAYRNGGRRQGKITFDKMYGEGYITSGTKLFANVYFDYQGSTALLSMELNPNGTIPSFIGTMAPSLGDASLGNNPLGDGLFTAANDQDTLPKFRILKGVTSTDCFEYALEVYSTDIDSRWEVLALGANDQLSINNAVEIVR